jgi:uncharacterized protein (DUF4415 family)
MSRDPGLKDGPIDDDENPEWTEETFARARPPHEIFLPEVLAAFPRTRGPQKKPTKRLVSLRFDQDVLDHFRATGRGWQARINEALRRVVGV